jgi:hypothetical protein
MILLFLLIVLSLMLCCADPALQIERDQRNWDGTMHTRPTSESRAPMGLRYYAVGIGT